MHGSVLTVAHLPIVLQQVRSIDVGVGTCARREAIGAWHLLLLLLEHGWVLGHEVWRLVYVLELTGWGWPHLVFLVLVHHAHSCPHG